jgi:type II secretory pathway pseudopilin PulG
MKSKTRGFTLIELLITVAIVIALAAIAVTLAKSTREKAEQTTALKKMRSLGTAFNAYVGDKNGMLPMEDAPGTDDWVNAAKPENQEVWYNALPKILQSPGVGEIGARNPELFYDDSYPLYIKGAPYPSKSKRLGAPMFAIAMNSRLQRKSDDGLKSTGRFSQIHEVSKTVVFLERGLPNDKKTMAAQRGFDGSAKANPRAFAARHNQKGCLVFADGHADVVPASKLMTAGGGIITPQVEVVWTPNPDDDPN